MLNDGVYSDSSDDVNVVFSDCASSSDASFYSASIPLSSALDTTFSQYSKSFNVIHINAQSIPAHYPDLLSSFDVKNIHAILVSESFLKPCLPSTSYALPGFHLIRNDRIGKGGGGVAIYLRSHVPFSILNKSIAQYSESSEHILIEVLFGTLKLLLGVFYSPSLRIDYFDGFEELLENYATGVDHTIIMGDFNTCLIKEDSRAKRLANIVHSANLNILKTNPTHFFPNCAPSLLDLMIVSSPDRINAHGQLPAEAFSYHDLVYLSYKLRPPKAKPTVVMRRGFKGFDNDMFMRELNLIDWQVIFNAQSVDEKLALFNSLLVELFDVHAPLRPVKLKHLPAPWLTEGIRALMSKRNVAKSKYKSNPSEENLLKYKKARNLCNKTCRDAQRNFIHSSLDNKDSAKIWRFLDAMGIGRQRKSSVTDRNIDIEALNNHFSSVTLLDSLTRTRTLKSISSCPKPNFATFHFNPVTANDVKKHITTIQSDAIGCDDVSRKMIILSLDTILPVLCHIFNHSLSSYSFPKVWRLAYVIPVPKTNNPSSLSQYRPISILPFLSKVLERIVHKQLTLYLSNNNILTPFQSGFRPGHSTVTALVKICDDIRYGIDKQKVSIVALLDFSNAFNTVDFEILLAILDSINISSDAIKWFRSYLYDRKQCIRMDYKCSSWSNLSAGVPQGGVLSPLLFSIFINSLSNILSQSFHLYADDLQIYTTASIDNISGAIEHLNSDLNLVSSWSKSSGLSINASKSQVILIGSRQQLSKINYASLPSVVFDGTTLEFRDSIKNLGVIMDSTFSWSPQISELSRKVYAVIGRLKRWKYFLPIRTKITLGQSLLLPILDYADTCYLDLPQFLLNKLERLQNLVIRFIFGLKKYDHISQYRRQLKWLTVSDRRNIHVLSLLYSVLFNPFSPPYLKERFTFLGSNSFRLISLRSKKDNKLAMPTSRSQCYSESFTVKAVILWNALPCEIRHSESIHIFKHRIKDYYLSM